MGVGLYEVVLADPPWGYRNQRTGGSHTSGSAQQYAVLTPDVVATLPIPRLAAPSSVCFLWATVPLGQDPYMVLAAWGYRFTTEWFWRKTGRKGIGYWTRGTVEKVLVGVRGDVKAWRSNVDNWFDWEETEVLLEEKPTGHSHKPPIIRDIITQLTPDQRRVELFATEIVPGWDSYGLALDPHHDFLNPVFWERFDGGRYPERAAAPLPDEPPAAPDPAA